MPEACTPAQFGSIMAELPAGVAVVTVRDGDAPRGLAVTSLTAYSADPPSVLLSIAHTSRCHAALVAATQFGVHVLRADQDDIAGVFASKADDKFAGLDWHWDGDVPCLGSDLAYLRCETSEALHHLDHTVLIGRIVDVHHDTDAEPMLYLRRRFAWRVSAP